MNDKGDWYFQSKFFDKEEDFWAYVKEWPIIKTDKETYDRLCKQYSDQLWHNISINEKEPLNGEMNNILNDQFIYLLNLFLYGKENKIIPYVKNENN